MSNRRKALRRTFSFPSVRRSLIVAALVGTALNCINQGDSLLHGEPVVVWKIALTYFVPFAVASFGSYAAFREFLNAKVEGRRGEETPASDF